MGLNKKLSVLCITVILLSMLAYAAIHISYVDNYFAGHSLYNITNVSVTREVIIGGLHIEGRNITNAENITAGAFYEGTSRLIGLAQLDNDSIVRAGNISTLPFIDDNEFDNQSIMRINVTVNQDRIDALANAVSPNGTNIFATLNDLVAGNVTVSSLVAVKNTAGATAVKGSAMQFSAYNSALDRYDVTFADSTAEHGHAECIMTSTVANNGQGSCLVLGALENFNTDAWSEGDALYLNGTLGTIVNFRPENDTCIQELGHVTRKHATVGSAFFYATRRCTDVPKEINIYGDINTSANFYQGGNRVLDTSAYDYIQNSSSAWNWNSNASLVNASMKSYVDVLNASQQVYIDTLNNSMRVWVLAQNYITNAVSDLVNYFTITQTFGHFNKNITSANASIKSYIDAKNTSDYLDRNAGWTNLTTYPAACPANTWVSTLGDTVTCTGNPDLYVFNTGDNLTGFYNHTSGNYTFAENGTACFGWSCKGQIYYNGSSLVIKVT